MSDEVKPKEEGAQEGGVLGRRGFFKLSAGAALAALGSGATGCGGATTLLEEALPPTTEPVVLVHLSDSHFGGESNLPKDQDPPALKVDPMALLGALLGEVVPAVKPLATVHTGDFVNEGFEIQPWVQYAGVFAGMQGAYRYPDNFVEILGNHDVKFNIDSSEGDLGSGLDLYAANTLTGQALGDPARLHGITVLQHGGGAVRLIRTNTSESALTDQHLANDENIDGYFTEAQRSALVADPAFRADTGLNIVLGHHPIFPNADNSGGKVIKTGLAQMLQLLSEAKAPLYLCGHVHRPGVAWVDMGGGKFTLMVQASAFGRNGQLTSFFLVAHDESGPAAKQIHIDATKSPSVAWPLVFITGPANKALGGNNQTAPDFQASQAPDLRVMVFPPPAAAGQVVTVARVRWMINSGAEGTLRSRSKRLWTDRLDLSGLAPGTHTVTVSAVVDVTTESSHRTLVGTDSIEIKVVSGVPA